MKNSYLFLIFFCMVSMLLIPACDNADIQKSVSTIEERSDCVDECSDCPIDDCCCTITLTEGSLANLIFCGVTDPCLSTNACSAEANGCTISGYELYATLTAANPTQFFCVNPNSAFYIISAQNISARMSCQYGQVGGQSVNITFNNPPNGKVYYSVDGDCELTSCL